MKRITPAMLAVLALAAGCRGGGAETASVTAPPNTTTLTPASSAPTTDTEQAQLVAFLNGLQPYADKFKIQIRPDLNNTLDGLTNDDSSWTPTGDRLAVIARQIDTLSQDMAAVQPPAKLEKIYTAYLANITTAATLLKQMADDLKAHNESAIIADANAIKALSNAPSPGSRSPRSPTPASRA